MWCKFSFFGRSTLAAQARSAHYAFGIFEKENFCATTASKRCRFASHHDQSWCQLRCQFVLQMGADVCGSMRIMAASTD